MIHEGMMLMKRIAPCKDCKDRHPGCHNASCPHGWAEYALFVEEERLKRKTGKEADAYAAGRVKNCNKVRTRLKT